jgi:glutaredoxin 2
MKQTNIKNKKINLYIGLKTQNNKRLNKHKVLNILSREFIKIGISGFNVSFIFGYWNNKKEKSILLSFFNTFNVTEQNLINLIRKLNKELNQECILLEYQENPFAFI